jgi:hypothetical protein
LNQLVDFYKIQYGGITIEDDLDPIIVNPVAPTIPKMADVQTSEMNAKLILVSLETMTFCTMIDIQRMSNI